MKKLILISVICLTVLFSCKKSDPAPVLTGTWDLYQTFDSGSTFNWTVVLTQDGKNLTGNAVISDGSGYALLLSSSSVTESNVTIEWMLSTYKLSCKGTLNTAYNSMNGAFYSNGIELGTWLANKKK